MEEMLAAEDPPRVTDVATSSDAQGGTIEVEAFVEAEKEGNAVDWLVDAFTSARASIENRRPTNQRYLEYQKQILYIEYLNDGQPSPPEETPGDRGE
ncbi:MULTISPECIES: hypothetical protein [unclassified Micromonospora]|uniref:hypothetical protein n=1 Tax=unclassified Micromonospora TaxID=2617518 RepID=UPI00098D15FF|nr:MULTISPECIES: hypothetical protein [unclassified Micromonospora]MDI5937354.1 hypothetical protein [Micromonospora sp. DH15]OON28189.1 hypothetical protein BSA16_28145 [Micromonospora sp. Rc5]